MNILLVEDDPAIIELIAMIITGEGHTVTTAIRGADALQLFQSQRYDLVITDFNMPGMNGLILAEKIKALTPSQKILLLSGEMANASPNVDNVVFKPIAFGTLIQVVSQMSPVEP